MRDCISENVNTVCDKIQFKLDKYAKNLVKYANEIENDYSWGKWSEKVYQRIKNNYTQKIISKKLISYIEPLFDK